MMTVYLLLGVFLLLALKLVLSEVRQILHDRRDAARTAHVHEGIQKEKTSTLNIRPVAPNRSTDWPTAALPDSTPAGARIR